MSAEIIKTYCEHFPAVRLIGLRYGPSDFRGGFSHKWGEWFEKGLFGPLEAIGSFDGVDDSYIGLFHYNETNAADYNYWIGIFFPAGTDVPEGYEYIDFEEGDVAACWIRGREDDGIFNMHEACFEKFREEGLSTLRTGADARVAAFERYNCPRYTTPDEQGRVILDYCAFIKR